MSRQRRTDGTAPRELIKKTCVECGCDFLTVYAIKKFCSQRCKDRAWNRKRKRPKTEPTRGKRLGARGPFGTVVTHVCCDCGRFTPDHRCPSCLEKWRIMHGVSLEDNENDDDI